MTTDRYIPGVPCWVDSTHPDPAAAGGFYGGLFGWDLEDITPPDSPDTYLMAYLGGERVAGIGGLSDASPNPAWNTYVWVTSVDETVALAVDAGATLLAGPLDYPRDGRMAMLADPQGAAFGLWEPHEHRGALVVNEAGSVNFNDLYTSDLEAAAVFYGSVFGWEVIDIEGDAMWALPGYGDFLDTIRPGTLKAMAEMGAPAGFENVVASLALTDDHGTPRWGVTFGVADGDTTSARAVELGGTVLEGPVDFPWVRKAIIADPQGAVFTASQFTPQG